MKKRNFWKGMLATVLVSGMVVVGCDTVIKGKEENNE